MFLRRRIPVAENRSPRSFSLQSRSYTIKSYTVKVEKPVGIFGGTFDPPHHGHVETAANIREMANLAKVLLVPNFEPVHKKPVASHKQRVEMTALAVRDKENFLVDDNEHTCIYDAIKLSRLKHPSTPLYFIMGTDTFMRFPNFEHKPEDYLQLTNILVASRPGYDLLDNENVCKMLRKYFKQDIRDISLAGGIYISPVMNQEVYSSTSIRTALSIDIGAYHPHLDQEVQTYIHRHGLYKMKSPTVTKNHNVSSLCSDASLFTAELKEAAADAGVSSKKTRSNFRL